MSGLTIQRLRVRDVGPIELGLEVGECVSLRGASGVGKSLLLRAIADLIPHKGTVALNGESASSMSGPAWRRRVGMLPAEPQWWERRVAAHFPPDYFETHLDAVAKLGLPGDIGSRDPSSASTGERQRLALLRLFVVEPAVVLLDEPTASLDEENARVVELFVAEQRRARDCAVLWVSHDDAQAHRVATRHFELRDSRLVELSKRGAVS